MNKEDLERVSGISRHHEQMWIKRDEKGKIEQLYDREFNPIDKKMLSRSFECQTEDRGFSYKGEFIEFEEIRDFARKRSQGFQRRNYGHSIEELL